jgi:hypothetical protein
LHISTPRPPPHRSVVVVRVTRNTRTRWIRPLASRCASGESGDAIGPVGSPSTSARLEVSAIRTRVEFDFMAIRFLEVCFWTDCAIWAGFKGSLEKNSLGSFPEKKREALPEERLPLPSDIFLN